MMRRTVLMLGLITVAPLMAAAQGVQAGKPAPQFAAVDSNGKAVKLADFKGKAVVLEWTNHDCPYVRKHYGSGNMQKLQAEAAAKGIVWLSVISSATGQQGHVDGAQANKLNQDRGATPTAVLLDGSGALGHLYGATATPHMFVIGPDGGLVYGGAIDNRPSASVTDVARARNFVREAMDAAVAGNKMTPATTRAYGCSVKYAGS